MINVDLGDGRIFPMEEHLLDGPHRSRVNNDHEDTQITEYRLRGKVVHRSVHVTLKHGIGIEGALGRMG
jgi:hypothetical protein